MLSNAVTINDNGVDVLAKVDRALMMVNSYDDDDRIHKRSKDKSAKDSKVVASNKGPEVSIPIPTFYCLNVDDNDDDKEDDDLLTMQPVFRKPQQTSVPTKDRML